MCHLQNIACDNQQNHDYQTDGVMTPEKVITMCRYASKATQNPLSVIVKFYLNNFAIQIKQ